MDHFESLLDRLEKVTVVLEQSLLSKNQSTLPTITNGGVPISVQEFQNLLANELKEYVNLSSKIGDVVHTHASMVAKCFSLESDIISLAVNHSKPTESQFKLILSSLSKQIDEISEFRDKHRTHSYFNHLSAVSESIAAIGWITQTPAPAPFVKTMQEAGEFYTNRVIKEFKAKDIIHVTWTKSLMTLWTSLSNYVKEYHVAGLAWNPKGRPATVEALTKPGSARVSKSPSNNSVNGPSSAIPPPPPDTVVTTVDTNSTAGDYSSLFADLNRGSVVTQHLRKVTDNMKTHKNPTLRNQDPVQTNRLSKSNNNTSLTNGIGDAKKSGCLELKGNKWIVEHFSNENNLQIVNTETKHTVCVHKCNRCTIQVKGKVNSIMLDDCKKTGLVFDHLISSVDVVNCQQVEVQCLGQLSTVNIDKTDGCQVYLSEQSKLADVITAKSSGINLCIQKNDGSFDEYPVAEQFKTNFTGRGLKTTATDNF